MGCQEAVLVLVAQSNSRVKVIPMVLVRFGLFVYCSSRQCVRRKEGEKCFLTLPAVATREVVVVVDADGVVTEKGSCLKSSAKSFVAEYLALQVEFAWRCALVQPH